ncbi:MAG: hypothetical protein WBI07_07600 [Mobilitalea sp.]
MDKRQQFNGLEKVNEYRAKIDANTDTYMEDLFIKDKGLDLLKTLRFGQSGYDPLFEESTNFIEQTNQTFTYIVCLKAVEYLLALYPGKLFYVNFGTESGYDVESKDGEVICECFSATAPDSNKKLAKDTEKISKNIVAKYKYVIYYASDPKPKHVLNIRKKYPEINIITLPTI